MMSAPAPSNAEINLTTTSRSACLTGRVRAIVALAAALVTMASGCTGSSSDSSLKFHGDASRFPRYGMDHGRRRKLTRGTDGRVPHDLPHDRQAAILSYDGGKMDGFGFRAGKFYAYTQLHPDQLPNYWQWA